MARKRGNTPKRSMARKRPARCGATSEAAGIPNQGALVGASAIGREISQRKRAENEIRQAKEALEAQVVDRPSS